MRTLLRSPNLGLVGMHGPPELTGLTLGEVDGWDIEIANQLAVAAGKRYVRHNLAIQFGYKPPARRTMMQYERWRPTELQLLARNRKRVLEIHDRPDAVGEYVAIGGCYQTHLLSIAAGLGITSVIGQDRLQVLGKYEDNTITVEFCRNDAGNRRRRVAENEERLRACMAAAAQGSLPDANPASFTYYESELDIAVPRAQALGLDRMGTRLQPFEPVPERILEILELDPEGDFVVDYWNSICSGGDDWFGGVLRRVPPPIEYKRPGVPEDPGAAKRRLDLTQIESPTLYLPSV